VKNHSKSQQGNTFNDLIFQEAKKITDAAHCATIMVFGDTMSDGSNLSTAFKGYKSILVTQHPAETFTKGTFDHAINVALIASRRFSQQRSALIIGIARNLFLADEKICCIAGIPGSERFDTISIVDVNDELGPIPLLREHFLPETIHPEIFERALSIASEIAMEGREGKSIGCLFILGDSEKVFLHTRSLILNPFQGHNEKERNILNPFMAEVIKEFSSIDGAFIIRGDGVIEAAGMMIQAPHDEHICLPPGLGTRHVAAANISAITGCIAIAVSQSTRHIMLCHHGKMLSLSERSPLKAEI
jgi:DNA integrity scanning protein DisA with diadenylate cyclase activity